MDADDDEHDIVNQSTRTTQNKPPRCGVIVPIIRSHTRLNEPTVDRDVVVHDLGNLFVLWVQKNAAEHRRMNQLSKEPVRFRRACNDLWRFNREFYETHSIVEQIQNQQSLGEMKREWLYDLFAESQERLSDLQHLIYFLESLAEALWEEIPSSEAENASAQALFWAQDAIIAAGPHLVYQLYRLDNRPIRRRDFMIGKVYLQSHTIQSLIEGIMTAEEE
ncbi:hypothetical protein FGG08_004314 [Glutinoglossum americanum]|uniref:Uncharacterized protein n=1 Tax=Glutinoglossum americanum TaxID=1670608 RepID=A0A9P8I5K4_9PEZI|nr:hypothetical protein FGG08_004314 [Glutinoglossum americanum]